MNIEASKLELIKLIADEQSEVLIERLKQVFKQEKKAATQGGKTETAHPKPEKATAAKNGVDQDALRLLAAQPTPKSIDLEQLKKEQGYDPEKLATHFRNLDRTIWEDEDMAELLAILRK